jgi:hypothetical protein
MPHRRCPSRRWLVCIGTPSSTPIGARCSFFGAAAGWLQCRRRHHGRRGRRRRHPRSRRRGPRATRSRRATRTWSVVRVGAPTRVTARFANAAVVCRCSVRHRDMPMARRRRTLQRRQAAAAPQPTRMTATTSVASRGATRSRNPRTVRLSGLSIPRPAARRLAMARLPSLSLCVRPHVWRSRSFAGAWCKCKACPTHVACSDD